MSNGYATLSGGYVNLSNGYATLSGGCVNLGNGYATLIGGCVNLSNDYATLSGGSVNVNDGCVNSCSLLQVFGFSRPLVTTEYSLIVPGFEKNENIIYIEVHD